MHNFGRIIRSYIPRRRLCFFFFFFPDDSVFNAKASSFISCRYHSQWTDAAFKFAMHLYLFFFCLHQHIYVTEFFFLQDIQSTTDLKSSAQGTDEVQSQQPNPMSPDAPAGASGSLSAVNNDNKKVCREDIELVRFKLSCSLYRLSFDHKKVPLHLLLHCCQLTE
jgi:hypothetical protein